MEAPIPYTPNFYRGEGVIFGGYHDAYKAEFADVRDRPKHRGVVIKFFDNTRTLRYRLTTNCACSPIGGLEFELSFRGCASFALDLLYRPKRMDPLCLEHGSWLEIYLWGAKKPIYTGIINRKPGAGSTERTIKIRGVGFVDFVRRVITHDASDRVVFRLQDTSVWSGVAAFASVLQEVSFVRHNPSKLENDPTLYGYSSRSVNDVIYIASKYNEALDELAKLEGGWIWGVDAERDLFFRPPAPCTTPDRRIYQGKDFQHWKPVEDSSKILNYALIQHGGTVQNLTGGSAERKGTNILPSFLKDDTSIAQYGSHAEVIQPPSVGSDVDAYRYAAIEIDRRKTPKIRGRAAKVQYRGEDFVPGECYEIVLKNADPVLIPLVRARYKLESGGRIMCDLNFGDESEDLIEWAKELEVNEALRTSSDRTRRYLEAFE
jgi:hypothetical protein